MDLPLVAAWLVFIAYFALILGSFLCVLASLTASGSSNELFQGRPFLYVRLAFTSLLVTWYCESLLGRRGVARAYTQSWSSSCGWVVTPDPETLTAGFVRRVHQRSSGGDYGRLASPH